ncbi:MAG: DUF5060 domain-containing protein [Cyclobacteriaceae bacterium]
MRNIFFELVTLKKVATLLVLLTVWTDVLGQEIKGELQQWHSVVLDFKGPQVSESDEENPFFYYRLNVDFTHEATGKKFTVPGFFAADGNSANTSATAGNIWRVIFTPDATGDWTYQVDFRKGAWASVSEKQRTGVSGEFMDGKEGTITIAKSDKMAPDFRAKGRLSYVGEHYLQFEGTKEYFLKQGSDAPENLLAYEDFDGTFHNDGHKDHFVKTWEAHLRDWKEGDPTWQDGKGKAIIGAINYLASEGLNAVSFLTLNIAGDDQNVFPYVDYDNHDRIDVSKMAQWEILFDHAQKLGIFLHFKTAEAENQGLLDNGGVGAYRKLYYRELIARFGHHLALNWNMAEESGEWMNRHETPPQYTPQRLAMGEYFATHDPYNHHLVIHNGMSYDDLLGDVSAYTGPSVQTHKSDFRLVHPHVLKWRKLSAEAGKPWAVAVDEPGDAQHSLLPDIDDAKHDTARQNALWGAMMAGSWGVEWYFGYKHAHSDLTCQDYRSRDLFWDQCKIALDFFNDLPFWEMTPQDELIDGNNYAFAKENETYVVYLKNGGTASLDLSKASGTFKGQYFNPRTGEYLKKGFSVDGGGNVALNAPKKENELDWAILLSKD